MLSTIEPVTNWSDVIQDYGVVTESQDLQMRIGNFGNEYERLQLKLGERRTKCETEITSHGSLCIILQPFHDNVHDLCSYLDEQLEWMRISKPNLHSIPLLEQAISSLDKQIHIKVLTK